MKKQYKFSNKKFKEEIKKQGFTIGKFTQALIDDRNEHASKALVHGWATKSVPTMGYMFSISKILKKEIEYFFN